GGGPAVGVPLGHPDPSEGLVGEPVPAPPQQGAAEQPGLPVRQAAAAVQVLDHPPRVGTPHPVVARHPGPPTPTGYSYRAAGPDTGSPTNGVARVWRGDVLIGAAPPGTN